MKTHVNARPCGSRGRRDAGYTFIELMLVLTVLGILVALAAPRLEGFTRSSRLRAAIDRISTDLTMARLTAVREGRPVTLEVQTATTYRIVVDATTTVPAQTVKRVDLSTEFNGVALYPSTGQVRFDSRGLVVDGGLTEVRARRGGYAARVEISGVGRIYREYNSSY